MKQKLSRVLAFLLVAGIVLGWALWPRPLDRMLKDLPAAPSIQANYFAADGYISAQWEAGSPEAREILALLSSTTYCHDLSSLLSFDNLLPNPNRQEHFFVLRLEDESGQRWLLGFKDGRVNFHSPGQSLRSGYRPADGSIKEQILAMAEEANNRTVYDLYNLK